jgi:RNA polymerase sigma factor (sigma-70 family)
MNSAHLRPVLRYIRRLAEPQQGGPISDGNLLERFISRRDEVAFALLVERHGSLVMGVCRRMLHDVHDAEDVFQATFLVLVRKAGSIAQPERLAQWLYGVAYRTALRARRDAAKRRLHEHQAAVASDSEMEEFIWRDLRPILDEEIQRLPHKYQAPVVLCYFGGRTKEEVAKILNLPVGTVSSLLARAREKLRVRLTRRGVALSAGLMASALTSQAVAAPVSASLIKSTAKAGLALAAGQALAGGLVSIKVASLTEEMVKAMFLIKVKMIALGLAAALVIGSGAGVVSYRAGVSQEQNAQEQKADPSVEDQLRQEIARLKRELERADKEMARLKEENSYVKVAAQREGILDFIGTLSKEGEIEKNKLRPLNVGDRVERGQLLGRVDDRLARDEMKIKEQKVFAAEAELASTEKTRDEAKQRYDTQMKLRERNATIEEDVRSAKLSLEKYSYEVISKRAAVEVTKAELSQARTVVEMHMIRSPVAGVIKQISVRPGEAVKSLETVFVIQPDEK